LGDQPRQIIFAGRIKAAMRLGDALILELDAAPPPLPPV
jgi:hypothetical protein